MQTKEKFLYSIMVGVQRECLPSLMNTICKIWVYYFLKLYRYEEESLQKGILEDWKTSYTTTVTQGMLRYLLCCYIYQAQCTASTAVCIMLTNL